MSVTKTTYAQSSAIKSRARPEYRRDMKKKAIAELEFLPILQSLLAKRHGDKKLRVFKHGGDAELWFSPDGKISQAPDYKAMRANGESFLYEFQYAEQTDNLGFFDFKVSKVGKKSRGGARVAYGDREFFYVVKPGAKYAFITPEWIMANGKEAGVSAWGNRTAFRVPHGVFVKQLADGGAQMQKTIAVIDDKNVLLEFQHNFLDAESEKLSRRLQRVVDEKKLVKIVPETPAGFYEVCFLLDKLNKRPDAPGVWMVYLAGMLGEVKTPMEMARFVFALDFLYGKMATVSNNEKAALMRALVATDKAARKYRWHGKPVDDNETPAEETRQMLFVVNLLEDLRQDAAVLLGADMPKVEKIFETVPDVAKTAAFVRKVNRDAAD